MAELTLHSGLDHFLWLDSITFFNDAEMRGEKEFFKTPRYLWIETAAQLGAYHVRLRGAGQRHAFLLKINHFRFLTAETVLTGRCELSASCLGETEQTSIYRVVGKIKETHCFEGELLIATTAEMNGMAAGDLQNYYQDCLQCLLKNTAKN